MQKDKNEMRHEGCSDCLYWLGGKGGCAFTGLPCPFYAQAPAPAAEPPRSVCRSCPYGRDSPCIGWCTKEVLRACKSAKPVGNGNRYGV